MPFRLFLFVFLSALFAAAITVGAAFWLFPDAPWTGPATMAVLAALALVWHKWTNRK
jgi:membrane protein implicated in regulation of membrane protease activity